MDTQPHPVTAERTVIVASKVGLHARPAAAVAKAAAALPVVVHIAKGGEPVDARSLLSLLALGAGHGDAVTLRATGEGAAEAVAALARVIEHPPDAGA